MRKLRQKVPPKQQRPSQQAQPQHNLILLLDLWVTSEGRVDDMGKVRLVADVDVAEKGEDLVVGVVAVVDEEVLEALEEFHEEEPEDAGGEAGVGGVAVDVDGHEEA